MTANDILILAVFVIGVGYGFFIGRARVITLMIASYVGLFVARDVAPELLNFLNKQHVSSPEASTWLSVALLAIVILFFELRKGISAIDSGGHGIVGMVVTAIYSFLTVGLLADNIIRLLPESQQQSLVNGSDFIAKLMQYHLVWLVAPLGLWMLLSLLRRFA